jgi:exocyst complex component 4
MRNTLALQQSLKALTDDEQDSEFERVKLYYSLFFTSPQEMLDGIREKQSFSFDEYQTMLNLQCGVDPAKGKGGEAVDRNYSLYVIDLHGLVMEKSDPSQ